MDEWLKNFRRILHKAIRYVEETPSPQLVAFHISFYNIEDYIKACEEYTRTAVNTKIDYDIGAIDRDEYEFQIAVLNIIHKSILESEVTR